MTSVLLSKSSSNKAGDQELLTGKNKSGEEEARAFLTFSSGGEDASVAEQGLCQRRRRLSGGQLSALTVCLLVLVGALAIAITCLELYHRREIDHLQTDLVALRRDVDSLKRRVLEEDLLNDLKLFEDAVNAEEAASDDEEEDDEEDEEDEDLDDVNYYGDEEDEDPSRHGKFHEKYEEMLKRPKRESESAVPVIAQSYGAHNKTGPSEGLRLYESLVAGGGRGEPHEVTEDPIKDYHRASPVWTSKHQRKHHREVEQQPQYHRHHAQSGTTQKPSSIISRRSRVMETDDDDTRRQTLSNNRLMFQTGAKQSTVPPPLDGEVVVRVYQDPKEIPQVRAGDAYNHGKPRRWKKRHPTKKTLENLQEEPRQPSSVGRRRMPAAHFHGDSSKYSTSHEHFEGNRLRHPGMFEDWTPSSWVNQLRMSQQFVYENGKLEVKGSGLYFVYAQIQYLDKHDTNGYQVFVNREPQMQCVVTTHTDSDPHRPKSNSCFTAAVLYLNEGDQLSVRDIVSLRYSVFERTKSFFGLFKIGHAKMS